MSDYVYRRRSQYTNQGKGAREKRKEQKYKLLKCQILQDKERNRNNQRVRIRDGPERQRRLDKCFGKQMLRKFCGDRLSTVLNSAELRGR